MMSEERNRKGELPFGRSLQPQTMSLSLQCSMPLTTCPPAKYYPSINTHTPGCRVKEQKETGRIKRHKGVSEHLCTHPTTQQTCTQVCVCVCVCVCVLLDRSGYETREGKQRRLISLSADSSFTPSFSSNCRVMPQSAKKGHNMSCARRQL